MVEEGPAIEKLSPMDLLKVCNKTCKVGSNAKSKYVPRSPPLCQSQFVPGRQHPGKRDKKDDLEETAGRYLASGPWRLQLSLLVATVPPVESVSRSWHFAQRTWKQHLVMIAWLPGCTASVTSNRIHYSPQLGLCKRIPQKNRTHMHFNSFTSTDLCARAVPFSIAFSQMSGFSVLSAGEKPFK